MDPIGTVVILIFKPIIYKDPGFPPKKNNQDFDGMSCFCIFFPTPFSPMTLRKNVKVVSTRWWQLKDTFIFTSPWGDDPI